MHLNSTAEPVYFPESGQASVLRLGLQPLAKSEWMLVDSDLPQFHRHKLEQEELHFDRVCQQLPQSVPAQTEFSQLLLKHLVNDQSSLYQLKDNKLTHDSANLNWSLQESNLWQSSLWIQEDICILELADDRYHLTAASVCSPSNWNLDEKIGRSINVIHDPVPGYREQLSQRVNRLLEGIKPGKPVHRFNWSIQHGNELFWREDLNKKSELAEKYWRVERQTLLRLPETRAIVFGIRIFLHSFRQMRQYSEFNHTIDTVVDTLPAEQKHYKGLG